MNRYLRMLFHYLFGNLTRRVAAISSNAYFPAYFSLILLSIGSCAARWLVRKLATIFREDPLLAFIFSYDVLNKPKAFETDLRNKVLIFGGTGYYTFFTLLNVLVYRNTDKVVWSHLYDLVVRNREQVSFGWWRRRSSESLNRRDSSRSLSSQISIWLNRLKTFPLYPRLKLLQSEKPLLHYPKLGKGLRLRAVRICLAFEVLMVLIYFYYLNILYFDLVGELRQRPRMTFAQAVTTAAAYLGILHAAFYTYAALHLVELVLALVGALYADQYRALNGDIEQVKAILSKANSEKTRSSICNTLHRSTAAYRAAHTRLTVFILRLNDALVSPVIAYYLHYYLPYHSYNTVYIYTNTRWLSLADAINQYWFLAFMWLFLVAIALVAARVSGAISRSGRTLSAIFARKGLLLAMKTNSDKKRRQSYYSAKQSEASGTIGHREALKLATYFEMIWREEKQLAFTAGQTDTAMNWKFISEVKTVKTD